MTASTLAIGIGMGYALLHVWGVLQPAAFRLKARAFPRHEGIGWVLMLTGTLWFLWRVKQTEISDFAAYKNLMYVGFAGIGLGTCLYVKDFLAVRGFAVLSLILAAVTLERVRWIESDLRLVVVCWVYAWVIAGIWFSISPWRMRDWIEWWTHDERRTRVACALRTVLGAVVAILGATVFRTPTS
ncbi:MAG: hypothetical protein FJ404_02975 [Verrucomicrobia bacterium]|nr:hypothetical protein [Verrucomicrobiota bacterium]